MKNTAKGGTANIRPTHTCFDDCGEIIVSLLKENHRRFFHLRIIHAICLLPESGEPFAHAWVEHNDRVFFLGFMQSEKVIVQVPKSEFQKNLPIVKFTSYTLPEAGAYNEPPPWKPEYKMLCGRSKRTEAATM